MADKSKGWIRLYRSILDHWLWEDDEPFCIRSAWIDILLMANHADKKCRFDGEVITIQKGQIVTSIRKLSARWKWGIKRTKNFLKTLENDNMIVVESNTKRTLLTIVNYGDFNVIGNTNDHTEETQRQHGGNTEETLRQHRGNTEETPGELNNNVKNDKNDKNEKNDKNDKNEKKGREKKTPRARYGEYKHVLLTEEEHNKLLDQLGERATTEYIKRVDEYCQQTGKRYQDYYLTILHWWNKDGGSKQEESKADRALRWLKEGGFGNGNG